MIDRTEMNTGRRTIIAIWIWLLGMVLIGCGGVEQPKRDLPQPLSQQELQEAHERNFRIWTDENLELLHQLAAEDIVYYDLAPNFYIQGRQRLAARLEKEFAALETTRFEARNDTYWVRRRTGTHQGEYLYEGQDSEGNSLSGTGYFLEVFVRDDEGKIRLINYISAPSPASLGQEQ